ncbi:hypothetical protein D9M73_149590 [compost metagenome]
MVRIDHVAHPGGFAAQIDISGAGLGAGGDEIAAIELVGADGGEHDLGAFAQRAQAGGVFGIGGEERGVGGRADQIAHFGQLGGRAPRHRTARRAAMREIFGDQTAGKAGRPENDNVEIAHVSPLPPGGSGRAGAGRSVRFGWIMPSPSPSRKREGRRGLFSSSRLRAFA